MRLLRIKLLPVHAQTRDRMEDTVKKRLIILCGFLGSGKTTVLRHLLAQCFHSRVAVLLNDFGDMPVDGAVVRADGASCSVMEIGGGSIFCSCLKEEFVHALFALARTEADMVFVEASGMSDPAGVQRLLELSGLDAWYDLQCTLCLFDPVRCVKLSHVLEVIPRQVAASDVVVLTKADLTTAEEKLAAQKYIASINPTLPILECVDGLLNFDDLPRSSRAYSALLASFNTLETRPDSFVLPLDITDTEGLVNVLRNCSAVLRVKGFVRSAGKTFYLSDTGAGFELTPSKAAPVPVTVICMQGMQGEIREKLHSGGYL